MTKLAYYTVNKRDETIQLHYQIGDAYFEAWKCVDEYGHTPVSQPHMIYVNSCDMIDFACIRITEHNAFHKLHHIENDLNLEFRKNEYKNKEYLEQLAVNRFATITQIHKLQAMLFVSLWFDAQLVCCTNEDNKNENTCRLKHIYSEMIDSLTRFEENQFRLECHRDIEQLVKEALESSSSPKPLNVVQKPV